MTAPEDFSCAYQPCGHPLCCEHGDPSCEHRELEESEPTPDPDDDYPMYDDLSTSRLPATECGGWENA